MREFRCENFDERDRERQRETERERQRETERDREGETERDRERQREAKRDRERQRETQRETERQRERQRDRERQRETEREDHQPWHDNSISCKTIGKNTEIQSNLRRKKFHRTNQGSNVLAGSLSNRDNVTSQIHFMIDILPTILKDDFYLKTYPSIFTLIAPSYYTGQTKQVEFFQH